MFVIYNIASTVMVGPIKGHPHSLYARTYKFAGLAARTCAQFNEQALAGGVGPGPYGWCSADHYQARVVRQVERVNLMSGQKYTEASNTPGYCSPSSEAYWSM